MESNKKYWKGLEEYHNTPEFVNENKSEFAEPIPIEDVLNEVGLSTVTPRRDFLKALGFGLGAVTLAACQSTPVHKSIPYLIKPEEVTPGVANYYTSSYKGKSVLVKTREGRPIKIEHNPSVGDYAWGSDSAAQASVLDLYDVSKLRYPLLNKAEANWEAIDKYVTSELSKAQASGKKIRIVSSSISSPSTLDVMSEFVAKYPAAKVVQYDPVSYSGIIQANQNSFGKAVVPKYNFNKADLIISFGADFLGSWLSGEEFTAQYVSNRNQKSLDNKKMSRHFQFETGMSLTGSNADTRIPIKPSEQGPALIALYNAVSGGSAAGGSLSNKKAATAIGLLALELQKAKGKALVVCGSNDVASQTLVNAINAAIGSYGATIDLDNPCKLYGSNDVEFGQLIGEMSRGEVGMVFFLNANPVYDFAGNKPFEDALKNVPAKVSFADRADETASLCDAVAINRNYLESWGDASAYDGMYSIVQPTINPVFNSRQAEESLLVWAAHPIKTYYDYVRNNWETKILPTAGIKWDDLLDKGIVSSPAKAAGTYTFSGNVPAAVSTISAASKALDKDIQIQLYSSVNIGDGKHANNAFLQELPDPVSKVTWDNFLAISPKTAVKLNINQFDVVTVKGSNGYSIDLPVLVQPGQAQDTASIALGYGRKKAGKVGDGVGQNAYPFVSFANGSMQYFTTATISGSNGHYELAQTQTHHSYEGRNIIQEATFAEYVKDPTAGSEKSEEGHKVYDLWNKYEQLGTSWVMAIDLNACTGCGTCVVACSVENNIPVVGRDEVRRRREMHWIRIDRYYSYENDGKEITKERELDDLDKLDNVSVIYQPMLCQHCDHAPCETVCPVLATVHSSDGLNHMAYNRCVGTRYCANNCPYKVRRFNWFNYWNDSRFDNYMNNEFTQLVLNPDVTTRSRGVMEKCSMCIQRIQAGKLEAKIERRPLKDGDIKTACQQACPANAIIMGDGNNPNSEVSKALRSERTYYVLEELGTKPGVGYMTKIRNKGGETVTV
ncbi:MoCo/4Fe-4S cofactor protein with predicted Tat translocation signal [Pedobacter sp. UYP30]|uniref:TAT-variant-translocated molybdopterin oxidoreductase n=1 Tax=Pedobacter sp. UYP30 TaxID=1756400 RepID=UPI00339588AF